MALQWLQMRIQEERERREKRAKHLARLPGALEELYNLLEECVKAYTDSFGAATADIVMLPIASGSPRASRWTERGSRLRRVEVTTVPELPGFVVERGDVKMPIEVGLLPSDKLYYRDNELDKYLNVEELTRRILDRVLFPALKEL